MTAILLVPLTLISVVPSCLGQYLIPTVSGIGCFQRWDQRHVVCAAPFQIQDNIKELDCLGLCREPICRSVEYDERARRCSLFDQYFPPPHSKFDPRFLPPPHWPWPPDPRLPPPPAPDPRSCQFSDGKVVIDWGFRYFAHAVGCQAPEFSLSQRS